MAIYPSFPFRMPQIGILEPCLTIAYPFLFQVVVGSFIAEGKKPKEEPQPKREPASVPLHAPGFGAASTASPPSDGTSSEHSDDPGSPMGPNGSTFANTGHPMHSTFAPVGWSLSGNQGRYDPDLKMMTDWWLPVHGGLVSSWRTSWVGLRPSCTGSTSSSSVGQ